MPLMDRTALKSRRAIIPWLITGAAPVWIFIKWLVARGGDVDFLLSLPSRDWNRALDWFANHGFWLCYILGVGWLLILAFRPSKREHPNTSGDIANIDVDLEPKKAEPLVPSEIVTRPTIIHESTYRSGTSETEYFGPKPGISKSVQELVAPLTNLTDREAKGYIESKKGCWLPVSGRVFNITDYRDSIVVIMVGRLDEPIIYCKFPVEREQAIRHLAMGAPVSLIGELRDINRFDVTLAKCELLNSRGIEIISGDMDGPSEATHEGRSSTPPAPDSSEAASIRGEEAGRPRVREDDKETIRQWRAMLAEAEEAYQQGRSFVSVLIRNEHWSELKARMKPEAAREVEQAETEPFGIADVTRRAWGMPRAAIASVVEQEISRLEQEWGLSGDR